MSAGAKKDEPKLGIVTMKGEAVEPQPQLTPASDLGQIESFMVEQFSEPKFGYDFSLVHITDTGTHEILGSRTIDKKLPLEAAQQKAREHAQYFYDFARNNVRTKTNTQEYGVVPFDKSDNPMGNFTFRLWPPASSMMGIGGKTESPTEQGVASQAMRLTEIQAGLGYKTTRDGVDLVRELLAAERAARERDRDRYEHLLDKKDVRINQLEANADAVIRMREDGLNQQLERDILKRRADQKDANEQRLWGALFSMAPIILEKHGLELPSAFAANFAGGGPGAPMPPLEAGAGPLEQMDRLFKSLTAEQKQIIVGCLSQAQAKELVEIMQAMQHLAPASAANGKMNGHAPQRAS